MPEGIPDFNSPVLDHARKDFPLLDAEMTIAQALEQIRREAIDLSMSVAEKILRRNISRADNDTLIADAIRQIETTRH